VGWLWVGDAVLLFVVIPVVLLFLNRVLRPAIEIKKYADDVLQHGVGLTGTLDAVPKLVDTLNLTTAAKGLVGRYGAALEKIL
jgi:galactitol-specific phosphotransferase system IIC component